MSDYELIKSICEKIAAGTSESDPDFREAKADGMIDNIISIFAECYDSKSFLEWLDKHEGDLFCDYRFADKTTFEEIAEELDNGNDNPDGVYDVDLEEWQELKDEDEKMDYIEEHLDCLMYSRGSGVIVISW